MTRIISSPLPAEPEALTGGQATIVMALDTLVNDKSVVVGLAEGSTEGPNIDDVRVSPVGQLVIDRCRRHMEINYPDAAVVVAGVASVGQAKQRVRQVLAGAQPQSLVLLLCANRKAYDAAYAALGIDFQAANHETQ